MKLWIIYGNYYETNATYSPLMMCESAKKYNIDYEFFFAEYFNIVIENGWEILYYKDKKINVYPDVAFFRCYKYELMDYLENKCVKLINSYSGMKSVRDKYETHKLVNKLKLLQPKVLFSNSDFDSISNLLTVPFVMKDNTGAKGTNVYLVENKEQFDKIKEECVDVSFIYQQYIKEAKGSDIRLYIVGDRVVGCINRKSLTDDFRANISLGGVGEKIDVPNEIKEQALLIAKKLNLEICSVDYLKAGDQYYFCEANGNASFSAFIKNGYKMQDIFMEYISNKYKNYHNYHAWLRRIEKQELDFVYENKNSTVVVSAPHNVVQIREGVKKAKDLGSGELALRLAIENELSYIIKTKNKGSKDVNDDANYYKDCDYRKQLEKLLIKNGLLIDIHSLAGYRKEDINIGINNGKNINFDFELINQLKSIFEKNEFNVYIDTPFFANEKTISADMHNRTGAPCIQLEINSSLINPKEKNNKIDLIVKCITEFIEIYQKR